MNASDNTEVEVVNDAQINMIKQQCRTWDILNTKILDLLTNTPREAFVPLQYRQVAYADTALPLGHHQHMFAPKEEAKILDKLQVHEKERVWELGTGSGYLTALLARLAKHVDSIDLFQDFVEVAAQKLQKHGIYNVSLEVGDGIAAFKHKLVDYDVIVLTAALKTLPKMFLSRLNQGGRLLAFVGEAHCMQAVLMTKISENNVQTEILFETVVDSLISNEPHEKFVF